MKASLVAVGSLLGSAAATVHHRHVDFHAKRMSVLEPPVSNGTCGCTTGTTTIYGAMTLHPKPPPAPTPVVSSYSAPGTYTISETTVTLTETTTVASASTASLTPGHNTYGGVTTTVTAPTTVTVPCATEEGTSPATTSIVKTSTHHCSTAGACIIGATTASVSISTITVYPVPATYPPGTYTVPESTVTVTDVNTVFVCPFETVKPAPPKPTYAAPAKPAAPVKPAAPAKPAAPYVPAAPVAAPPAKAPSAPKPKPHSYGGGSAPIKPNGNKWAMAYTPYAESGACKTAFEVDADISIIALKGFTSVRIYATDCSGLVNVGAACQKHGLKLIAGVFINEEGIGKAAEQVTELISWGSQGNNWATIEMCVVGNEAIFNQFAGASELAGFISSTKQKLSSAGYGGPITTTEPLGTLMSVKDTLCSVIDVVAANIQPYFNSDVSSSKAGDFVASQLELTGQQCPGKEAYNLECGWPSQGSANGNAVAGAFQQKEAIENILSSSAAGRTAIFSFQNDAWKSEGEFGVEPWFGCAGIL